MTHFPALAAPTKPETMTEQQAAAPWESSWGFPRRPTNPNLAFTLFSSVNADHDTPERPSEINEQQLPPLQRFAGRGEDTGLLTLSQYPLHLRDVFRNDGSDPIRAFGAPSGPWTSDRAAADEEASVVARVSRVLSQNSGIMTSANLGSTLASGQGSLYRNIKVPLMLNAFVLCMRLRASLRYLCLAPPQSLRGGLCSILSRYPERFILADNPPLNHVVLRARGVPPNLPARPTHCPVVARRTAASALPRPAEPPGFQPLALWTPSSFDAFAFEHDAYFQLPKQRRAVRQDRSMGQGAVWQPATFSGLETTVLLHAEAILNAAAEGGLKAVELANTLRAHLGTEVLAAARNRSGGLLSLLERSPLFVVQRIPKSDWVTLSAGARGQAHAAGASLLLRALTEPGPLSAAAANTHDSLGVFSASASVEPNLLETCSYFGDGGIGPRNTYDEDLLVLLTTERCVPTQEWIVSCRDGVFVRLLTEIMVKLGGGATVSKIRSVLRVRRHCVAGQSCRRLT